VEHVGLDLHWSRLEARCLPAPGMDYADFISKLSFRVWPPDVGRPDDRRLLVPRRSGDAKLVELPQMPVDVMNFVPPPGHESLDETIRPLCRMPRMSTYAMGSIINRAVAAMPADHSYVNVGTWVGFSLMAGMAGNPAKTCIGIDNFSEFGGPRQAFHERFDRLAQHEHHHFHEMDYEDYFASVHRGPIGVYLYDGEHSYENQLRGLQVAEPYFGDECVVIVDDTNWGEPYQATYDFIAQSNREYTVLLDQRTAGNVHPTFWNGVLLLHSRAREPSAPPPSGHAQPRLPLAKHYDPVKADPPPLVSLVLHHRAASEGRLEAAIEEAHAQSWPAVQVVVSNGTPLAEAVDATSGQFVAIADTEVPMRPDAVRMGLAFPRATEFNSSRGEKVVQRLERVLQLIDEVTNVVPPGSKFALANEYVPVPMIDDGRAAVTFETPEDDARAVERLGQLRASGTDFLVLAWPALDWLERFPAFRGRLESGRRVLESDHGLVFDLRW
jgi:Methyltransferase domain